MQNQSLPTILRIHSQLSSYPGPENPSIAASVIIPNTTILKDIIGINDAAICVEKATPDHLIRDCEVYPPGAGGGGGMTYGVYGIAAVYGVGGTIVLDVCGGVSTIAGDGSGVGSEGRAGAFGGTIV